MKLLCIETSTDVCSICLSEDGTIVSIRETGRDFSHSQTIGVFIEECLAETGWKVADLDAVAFAEGPGSYTALRIGSSFVKGLCYAQDIPLVTIPTLEALAHSTKVDLELSLEEGELVIPLLDARRKEVYRTIYNHKLEVVEPLQPIVLERDTFQYLSEFKLHFVGDGVPKSKEILDLGNGQYHDVECSAKYMVDLAIAKYENNDFADITYFEPNYFKKPNIVKSTKKLL